MPRLPVRSKAPLSEAIQFAGTDASAREIVEWVRTAPNPPAVGATGSILYLHGVPVIETNWVVREGATFVAMSNAAFTERYDRT